LMLPLGIVVVPVVPVPLIVKGDVIATVVVQEPSSGAVPSVTVTSPRLLDSVPAVVSAEPRSAVAGVVIDSTPMLPIVNEVEVSPIGLIAAKAAGADPIVTAAAAAAAVAMVVKSALRTFPPRVLAPGSTGASQA